MRKLLSAFIFLFLSMLLLCGCFVSKPIQGETRELMDDTGRHITVPLHPKRIISLSYGTDEILFDLVPPDRIAALSKYAGDMEITFITPEMRDKVGQTTDMNPETIIRLNPDLVIASLSVPSETVTLLSDSGIPVYISGIPKTYDGIKQKVRGVAKAVHEESRGESLIQNMDERLAIIENKLHDVAPEDERIAVGLSWKGGILGKKGTLFADVLKKAHVKDGANIYSVPKGASAYLSDELLPKINPDVILLPVWKIKESDNKEKFAKKLIGNPAFQDITAIKENHLILFPEKYKFVMSHHVVDAIEVTAKAVYPELLMQNS